MFAPLGANRATSKISSMVSFDTGRFEMPGLQTAW
jgi:hypothetical protein